MRFELPEEEKREIDSEGQGWARCVVHVLWCTEGTSAPESHPMRPVSIRA